MTLTHTHKHSDLQMRGKLIQTGLSYKAKRSLVIKTLDIQCCSVDMEGWRIRMGLL